MNKPDPKKETKKKSSHALGPYSFCPKHNVFYASCKCPIPYGKKKAEGEDIE